MHYLPGTHSVVMCVTTEVEEKSDFMAEHTATIIRNPDHETLIIRNPDHPKPETLSKALFLDFLYLLQGTHTFFLHWLGGSFGLACHHLHSCPGVHPPPPPFQIQV
jgi:hypothetical protein